LSRIRNLLAADLDHADPLEEAKQMLQQKPYGLGFVRARNREPRSGFSLRLTFFTPGSRYLLFYSAD